MPHRSILLLLPLVALSGCWGSRDAQPSAASTPGPASTSKPQAAPELASETRRALIAQRLARRPLNEELRTRLVESWVVGSEGFDQAAMDRLLGAIDSSIQAVDENRFNATKDLAEARPAVAGSTMVGALISGLVANAGGRQPIAVDCGGIRANGWVERSSARTNRAAVIITSISVREVSGKQVTYQHADGLAYVMGPDGLEGLTLQPVTDQRGNSWLGLRAGTLVTLILIRQVDQLLVVKDSAAASVAASAPLAPTVSAGQPPTATPVEAKPATPTVVPAQPAAAEPASPALLPAPTATPPEKTPEKTPEKAE